MMSVSPMVVNSQPTSYPPPNEGELKSNLRVLTGLGIVEVFLGISSITISCVLITITYGSSEFYNRNGYDYVVFRLTFNTGEGIWCGVWILIAGAFGVACGRKKPSLCLLTCHMISSTAAIPFAVVMFALGIVTALVNSGNTATVVLENLLAIFGFISLVLCIVSDVFCWMAAKSSGYSDCCGGCCLDQVTDVDEATHLPRVSVLQQVNQQPLIPPGQQQIVQTNAFPAYHNPAYYNPSLPANQQSYQLHTTANQPYQVVQQPGNAVTQPYFLPQPPGTIVAQPYLIAQQPGTAFTQTHHSVSPQIALPPGGASAQLQGNEPRLENENTDIKFVATNL